MGGVAYVKGGGHQSSAEVTKRRQKEEERAAEEMGMSELSTMPSAPARRMIATFGGVLERAIVGALPS